MQLQLHAATNTHFAQPPPASCGPQCGVVPCPPANEGSPPNVPEGKCRTESGKPVCNTCAPCDPCNPCAPACGVECGLTPTAIAVGIGAVIAAAAIILATGEHRHAHH